MKRTALSLCLVAGISTCVQAQDFRPSTQDQIKIGKQAAAEVRKKERILPDRDPRVQLLRKLGEQLVEQIPEAEKKRRPFEYTFDIIDSKDVNAFAFPGGPIFFYSGLIDRMTTVDQLAGVLGHEIVHVRNQHWASQEGDRIKRQVPLMVLLQLLNAGRTAWDIAALADAVLIGVKYSRRHESESDRVGYDLMTKIGYNPAGLSDTFRMFAQGRRQSDFEKILSSHPDPAKRAEDIDQRIKKEGKTYRAQRALPFQTSAKKQDMSGNETNLAWSGCWCGSTHGTVALIPILASVQLK